MENAFFPINFCSSAQFDKINSIHLGTGVIIFLSCEVMQIK